MAGGQDFRDKNLRIANVTRRSEPPWFFALRRIVSWAKLENLESTTGKTFRAKVVTCRSEYTVIEMKEPNLFTPNVDFPNETIIILYSTDYSATRWSP